MNDLGDLEVANATHPTDVNEQVTEDFRRNERRIARTVVGFPIALLQHGACDDGQQAGFAVGIFPRAS